MKGLKEIVLVINCSNIISIIDIIPSNPDDLCWCWTIRLISLLLSLSWGCGHPEARVLQCNGRSICPELRNPEVSLELSLYSSGSQLWGDFVNPSSWNI